MEAREGSNKSKLPIRVIPAASPSDVEIKATSDLCYAGNVAARLLCLPSSTVIIIIIMSLLIQRSTKAFPNVIYLSV